MRKTRQLLVCMFLVACTRPNPAATCTNGQCIDPEFSFCDRTGAIGGTPDRCLAVDCIPNTFETCAGEIALTCNAAGTAFDETNCGAGCDAGSGCLPFCTPNAVLSCEDDQLIACNAEGTSTTMATCALGCAAGEARCATFEPSNGLGPALEASANEPDVSLPVGTRIDSDTGLVQDGNGTTISLKSIEVAQAGAPSIRVFQAKSLSTVDVTITGNKPVAFVATGTISIGGRFSARAQGRINGPGARSAAACAGQDSSQFDCACAPAKCSAGAGGAGNHQAGGRGGAATSMNGGTALTGFSPLAGGCAGGAQRDVNGVTVLKRGGGGGGAIQIVSGAKIALTQQGLFDVGGGGGESTSGGGSGGMVVLEAPQVSISGAAAGAVANGGAGGGCGMTGPDATATTAQAPGATCMNYFSGSGGTGTLAPGNGCRAGVDTCEFVCPVIYGGGGGSVGRMRIATKDGTFESSGNPLFSVPVTTAGLAIQ